MRTERYRKWDRVMTGVVIGLAVPVAALGILLTIYDGLEAGGLLEGTTVSPTFRHRTLSLVAICMNIIPVEIFRKRYMYNAMRGMVFPTLFFIVLWVVRFWDIIFGS